MKRKTRVLLVSYLAAAFLVMGGFLLQEHGRAGAYARQMNNDYQHAFTELTTAVHELDTVLQKGRYATSGGLMVGLCAQGFERANAAQAALGGLPYANVELEQTSAFLGKAGDYLYYLAEAVASRGACTQEEREALAGLSAVSSGLSAALEELQADMNAGTLRPEDLERATQRLAQQDTGGQAASGSTFQALEADLPEVPSLVYDGPFSEHLTDRAPKMLEGMEQVTEAEARQAAAQALGMEPEQLTLTSEGEGELPAYGFSGGGFYLEVTRQGGQISVLLADQTAGEKSLTPEEGVARAAEYLQRSGFGEMAESYWSTYGNGVTVSFASVQDGVMLYPDLVKVTVSLVDGRVIGLECAGYLVNHCTRTLPAVSVSQTAAQEKLTSDLAIQSCRLALIPSRGEYEVLCYEFTCETPEGGHCLVYVNAQNGREEKILLLLEDENGTLAQ